MSDSKKLRDIAKDLDALSGILKPDWCEENSKELERIADDLESKAAPSDEEIFKWANEKTKDFNNKLLARQCLIEGAHMMRDKMKK